MAKVADGEPGCGEAHRSRRTNSSRERDPNRGGTDSPFSRGARTAGGFSATEKSRAQTGNKTKRIYKPTASHDRPTASACSANSGGPATSAYSDPASLHLSSRAGSELRSARSRRANVERLSPGISSLDRAATKPLGQTPVGAGSPRRDYPARNFWTTPQFTGARSNQRLLVCESQPRRGDLKSPPLTAVANRRSLSKLQRPNANPGLGLPAADEIGHHDSVFALGGQSEIGAGLGTARQRFTLPPHLRSSVRG
jgi:hypothetical protein